MAAYHRAFAGLPAIFEEVELGVFWPGNASDAGLASRLRRQITWAKHRRYTARLLEHFACCTVASELERRLLSIAAASYAPVHVVPNSVDTSAGIGVAREANTLIFAGSMRFAPNRDAMTWFVEAILPHVRARVPGARLTITGDAWPRVVRPHGRRDADRARARRAVARRGLGRQPRANPHGRRHAAEDPGGHGRPARRSWRRRRPPKGIDAHPGEHLLVADTPREFADAVCRLLDDPAGAAQMAERAWRLCLERYDARVVASTLVRLAETTAVAA